MTPLVRLTVFAAALALLFTAGALAGCALEPKRDRERKPAPPESHGAEPAHAPTSDAPHPVRGLGVTENGLRLAVDQPELARGREETLRFRILDDAGETVRDFDVEHTKRMHVIVARRDLTGFQHLHPRQNRDGGWELPLRLDDPGSYRLFADFSHGDVTTTLATDLRVDGSADLQALPAPATAARSDRGYDVELHAEGTRPGVESALRFTITRDGKPVETEPYLGAGGHLVALREGDLAFLHVHPTGGLDFAATFPTAGRYRLFLQFQEEGEVHTVAFTQEVS